jgi:hypothetical protein
MAWQATNAPTIRGADSEHLIETPRRPRCQWFPSPGSVGEGGEWGGRAASGLDEEDRVGWAFLFLNGGMMGPECQRLCGGALGGSGHAIAMVA